MGFFFIGFLCLGMILGGGVQRQHDLELCKQSKSEKSCKKDLHIPERK